MTQEMADDVQGMEAEKRNIDINTGEIHLEQTTGALL